MLWQEFVARIGFGLTFEEHAEIEDAYYHFDGNKDAFCEDFVKNGGEQKGTNECHNKLLQRFIP